MNKEKLFLEKEKRLINEKINSLTQEIENLQGKTRQIDKKIKEDDIIERVLVTDVKIVETNLMRFNESEGLVSKGYYVLETPKTKDFVFRFLRIGSKVICTIYDYTGRVELGRGVSKCHYEDGFDYQKGVRIAELRAMQDKLKREEVKYY